MKLESVYRTIKLISINFATILTVGALVTACNTSDNGQKADEQETATSSAGTSVGDSLMRQAMAASDADRMLSLADSLEAAGAMSPIAANYYRGGAYAILQKVVMADSCLRKATDNVNPAPQDRKMYLAARTLLAQNLLEKNFAAALHEALPLMTIIDSPDYEASFSDKARVTRVVASSQLHLGQEREADQTSEILYGYIRDWMNSDITGDRHSILAHMYNVSSDYLDTKNYAKGMVWTQRADSVWRVFDGMPDSDRDDLNFFKGAIALNFARAYQGLGRTREASAAYNTFKNSAFGTHPIGRINSTYYLLEAKRYIEAANNLTDLDQIIADAGYDMSLENIGSLMIPKLQANLGANRKDSALVVAARIAESFEQAFKDQKRGDAVEMAVVYDTQEKERSLHEQEQKIAAQDAKLSRTRLRALSIGFVAVVLFLLFFLRYRNRQAKRLAEERASRERIEGELNIARNIQMSMVPSVFPEIDGLDMFALMTPAKEVGGDLYNYLLLGDKLYFCIGDVSGKGVPASLVMAIATRGFRTLAMNGKTPAEIATQLNAELTVNNDEGMFVTMFICCLDLKLQRLEYCNAGHNPPIIGNADGQFSFLEVIPNAPIGLWPGLEFEGEEIEYMSNRKMLLYTDGLNEAENPLQEQYGDDRVINLLTSHSSSNCREIVEALKAEIEHYRDGAEPNDDLTLLAFSYSGAQ